jgi:hypothetical protein
MTPVKIEHETNRVADRAIFSMSYWIVDELKQHASTLLDARHCLRDQRLSNSWSIHREGAKKRSSISVSSMGSTLQ